MKSYNISDRLICKEGLYVFAYDYKRKEMVRYKVSIGDKYIVEDIEECSSESVNYLLTKVNDEDNMLSLYNDEYYPWVDKYFDKEN